MRWGAAELTLLDHPYNDTALNERAWEVPLALSWLQGRQGPGLEVGNVLGHYGGAPSRRVVDLYEEAPGVEQLDVFDIDGCYRWVVAISTIEHVRHDPPEPVDPHGAELAAKHLHSLVAPGGSMLVTVPFGQHPHLDQVIVETGLGADRETTMVWTEYGWQVVHGVAVLGPLRERHWPTCVWVGEWGPE